MKTEISIHLFLTEGSSNKEYNVFLVSNENNYSVNFTYGPRGNPRSSGTKTASPLAMSDAKKIFDKLVAKKMSEGYASDSHGAPFTQNPDAGRISGWRPALLSVANDSALESLLRSPYHAASEKMDGERRAVEVQANGIRGMNRKGLYVPAPAHWEGALMQLPSGTLVDAEHVDSNLHIFDCVRFGSEDLTSQPYEDRVRIIRNAISFVARSNSGVSVLDAFTNPDDKRALLDKVKRSNGEGLVFRHIKDSYQAGITEGSIKYKLYESSTCIVSMVNSGVHSVGLSMYNSAGVLEFVGNVTLPPSVNAKAGDLLDVRYMHRFAGGSLYQPVYQRHRTDLEESSATLTQIKRIKIKGAPSDLDDADPGASALCPAQKAASNPRKMRP